MASNSATQLENTTRVLVVGAGPAGLLAAINLLRRNLRGNTRTRYQVTLVDPGVDYGQLDESGLKRFRSWMIGLSAHGLRSVKEVPGLFEDYISQIGVNLTSARFALNSLIDFQFKLSESDREKAGFLVDRNYICAGLARYLNDNFASKGTDFIPYYQTKALFVDNDEKRVFVRTYENNGSLPAGELVPLEYDILLGCDGVRSVVRNAFIINHRDFSFDIQDNFGEFKAVHIPVPKDCDANRFMVLFNILPNCISFCLPERGGMLNLGLGWDHNNPAHPDLLSKDEKVVADYFRKNLKYIKEVDFDEIGKLWAQQDVSTTSMAHCNFYHSDKLKAIIMGDAAHATTPNIGQGMNTALADASALNALLDKLDDNWDDVLPAFSEERVKEGNALTDLSFHTYSLDKFMMMEIVVRQNLRQLLSGIFPAIEPEPVNQVGMAGASLSEAYDKLARRGYLNRSRRINQDIMRKHFEKRVGMVKSEKSYYLRYAAITLAVVVGIGFQSFKKGKVDGLL